MEILAKVIQYITGPFQLAGFVLLVLAGVVKSLPHKDYKTTRYYALGLLGLGAIAIVGGIWSDLGRGGGAVTDNTTSGDGNAIGNGNVVGERVRETSSGAQSSAVTNNTVTGNGNAVGNSNVVTRARE